MVQEIRRRVLEHVEVLILIHRVQTVGIRLLVTTRRPFGTFFLINGIQLLLVIQVLEHGLKFGDIEGFMKNSVDDVLTEREVFVAGFGEQQVKVVMRVEQGDLGLVTVTDHLHGEVAVDVKAHDLDLRLE